jgi:transcriptional adapter 1
VNPVSLLPFSVACTVEKPQLRYCSQDLTLPDAGLVHGRMLVAAWDAGLDHGCEDKAIKLILAATKQFLRELIIAIITNRKGYRLRENKVIHSVGQPTLNPWLHNSWSIHDGTSNRYVLFSYF